MEINRIDESGGSEKAKSLRSTTTGCRCLFYKEEMCHSTTRFPACRSCFRRNPHLAVLDVFKKIKKMAVDLFNLPETKPDQPPREK